MSALDVLREYQWKRVLDSLDAAGPCWLWTKAKDQRGYGQTVIGSRTDKSVTSVRIHKLVYERLVGPVPDGLELDHLCKVKHCANPDHLEPVSHSENIQRYYGSRRQCPHGHEYTAENSGYFPNGYRYCRKCNRDQGRRYRKRMKAKRDDANG